MKCCVVPQVGRAALLRTLALPTKCSQDGEGEGGGGQVLFHRVEGGASSVVDALALKLGRLGCFQSVTSSIPPLDGCGHVSVRTKHASQPKDGADPTLTIVLDDGSPDDADGEPAPAPHDQEHEAAHLSLVNNLVTAAWSQSRESRYYPHPDRGKFEGLETRRSALDDSGGASSAHSGRWVRMYFPGWIMAVLPRYGGGEERGMPATPVSA